MCSCSGYQREKHPVALDNESKRCNPLTELELNMDWAETGLAQALKVSTSTPGRRP